MTDPFSDPIFNKPGATSEGELVQFLKRFVYNFKKMLCGDEASQIVLTPGNSYLINLCKRGGAGSHWTALRVCSSNPGLLLYIDSIGYPPPQSFTDHARANGMSILCSDSKWQQQRDTNDKSCGQRAIISLYRLGQSKNDLSCFLNELAMD